MAFLLNRQGSSSGVAREGLLAGEKMKTSRSFGPGPGGAGKRKHLWMVTASIFAAILLIDCWWNERIWSMNVRELNSSRRVCYVRMPSSPVPLAWVCDPKRLVCDQGLGFQIYCESNLSCPAAFCQGRGPAVDVGSGQMFQRNFG